MMRSALSGMCVFSISSFPESSFFQNSWAGNWRKAPRISRTGLPGSISPARTGATGTTLSTSRAHWFWRCWRAAVCSPCGVVPNSLVPPTLVERGLRPALFFWRGLAQAGDSVPPAQGGRARPDPHAPLHGRASALHPAAPATLHLSSPPVPAATASGFPPGRAPAPATIEFVPIRPATAGFAVSPPCSLCRPKKRNRVNGVNGLIDHAPFLREVRASGPHRGRRPRRDVGSCPPRRGAVCPSPRRSPSTGAT